MTTANEAATYEFLFAFSSNHDYISFWPFLVTIYGHI